MLSTAEKQTFRAYDIRGIFNKTFTPALVFNVGRALAEELAMAGKKDIVVGRDGRVSGPELVKSLIAGLIQGGAKVKNIGMVPTPATYLAGHYHTGGSAVMLTGSHNPPEYNGCKMMINGETLAAERIIALRDRIAANEFTNRDGGYEESFNFLPQYLQGIVDDIHLAKKLKVIVDCGNGVTGVMARELFTKLGCEVDVLFEEIDGNFPNHHPDPSHIENLKEIMAKIQKSNYDVGLAFDGDGDRVGVITKTGKVYAGDQLVMLFAEDVLKNNPGAKVLYDVKCSSLLAPHIKALGGEPIMVKTGHALIKREIRKTHAKLAGEMSGHVFFNDRMPGYDDAVYAAGRLLAMIAEGIDIDAWLNKLPKLATTPELNIACEEGEPHLIVEKLQKSGNFENAQVNSIDGVRAEFDGGFGLIRPSNTTPILVLRFEAKDSALLKSIQNIFARELLKVKPEIKLPF